MGGQRGPGSPVVAAGRHHQGQTPPADQLGQQDRVGLVKGAGRVQGYFTRYFSNQARMAEALAPDEMPEEMRDRLLQEGFVRIDSNGLFSADRYVTPDQIQGVSSDGLLLRVTKAELVKRP